MKYILQILLTALFLSPSVLIFSQQQPDLPQNLDRYIDTVLKTFAVPGLSIAVVRDGKVLIAKGYGVKVLGQQAQVSAHTLFPIASNSKAFTATALAMLAEEGKIKWDDPVIDYLPWFKMSDPWVTAQITIRDLLVHYSGIPAFARDILLFPPSTYTRREIISKIKGIPIVHSFRTTYAYDNILYLAAGEIVKAVTNMEWEDFIQTRIFDKLNMGESVARFSALKTRTDVAAGHSRIRGKVKVLTEFLEQDIGDASDPAGGIASNAVDMAKWLITQLDSGKASNNTRIYKSAATKELWKMVTPIPISAAPEELKPAQMNFWGYALGMRTYNYGRYKMLGHGGKLDGFVSQVTLVPELKLGIAILTNQESTGAYWSVIYHLLDYYLKNQSFNWIAGYKSLLDSSLEESKRDWQKAIIKPGNETHTILSPDKYTGHYKDPIYGDLIIKKDSSGLVLQFTQTPQLIADLKPFQYNTFIAEFHNRNLKADSYVSFLLAPDGSVDELKLKVIDPDSDLSFDELLFKPAKE